MHTILQRILAHKRREIELARRQVPQATLLDRCANLPPVRSLQQAVLRTPCGIIAEFKRRSPSKGMIHPDADAATVTAGYAQAGAAGISVLTDTAFFGGSSADLHTARQHAQCPILRKEFIIDEYQLAESRAAGADAVLLIAAALSQERCRRLAATAQELGLEVLLELHTEAELDYVCEGISLVGVNNRNLDTFRTDTDTSFHLAQLLPPELPHVSESGLHTPDTVRELRAAGYQGFLMGEYFMREAAPARALQQFIAQISRP